MMKRQSMALNNCDTDRLARGQCINNSSRLSGGGTLKPVFPYSDT